MDPDRSIQAGGFRRLLAVNEGWAMERPSIPLSAHSDRTVRGGSMRASEAFTREHDAILAQAPGALVVMVAGSVSMKPAQLW